MKKFILAVPFLCLGASAVALSGPSKTTDSEVAVVEKETKFNCPGGASPSVSLELVPSAMDLGTGQATFSLSRKEDDTSTLGAFEIDLINSSGAIVSSAAGEWDDETQTVGTFRIPAELPSGVYFLRATVSGLAAEDNLESHNLNHYLRVDGKEVSETDFNSWMATAELAEVTE